MLSLSCTNSIAASSKSFIKVNSRTERKKSQPKIIDRLDSLRGSCSDSLFDFDETFGPLSNVRLEKFAYNRLC